MNIIFLGPQGSGKSTQAKMVADILNIPYIEMGQMLRDIASGESNIGNKIKKSLNAGELVPDNIAVSLLNKTLNNPVYNHGFILDGYPRNRAQIDGLKHEINKVFYIKVSDAEAIRRLSLRARHDDTEELLKRRLTIYHEKTEPLLSEFKRKGILVEINGERSIEEINKDIELIVKNGKE
ncbi:MAG: Adenylate kinase [Candidatus Curtissbacteria bacterium GW2011_GWA1_40_9]|uniref:Adenylate kinase n=1 Tax=Candidatus Curtissbacteria bacterium GW2011_GWA1_40_9 TaxID=1618408 RepID=A0A0G0W111_9BACT|nr:MAG: Adenylate kinase [Candidatus Curtissbacteria bacterium GW2011_GWA1_40_9]